MSIDIKTTLKLDLVWEVSERGSPVIALVSAHDEDRTLGQLELSTETILAAFPEEGDDADQDEFDEASDFIFWLRSTADKLAEQTGCQND